MQYRVVEVWDDCPVHRDAGYTWTTLEQAKIQLAEARSKFRGMPYGLESKHICIEDVEGILASLKALNEFVVLNETYNDYKFYRRGEVVYLDSQPNAPQYVAVQDVAKCQDGLRNPQYWQLFLEEKTIWSRMMMNAQIEDLSKQAWKYANNYTGADVMPQIKRYTEKFAELILRDAADYVGKMRHVLPHQAELTKTDLLKHFGVD